MVDHFKTLGVPRRPWIAADELKAQFHALSLQHHPDHANGDGNAKESAHMETAEINRAFNTLRNVRERLGHLLELENGQKPATIQQVPPNAIDLSMKAAQLCQEADKFLQRKRQATSPMMQAQMLEQGLEWSEKIEAVTGELQRARTLVEQEVQELNAAWTSGPIAAPLPLAKLEASYCTLSFLIRWEDQLRDRMLQSTM